MPNTMQMTPQEIVHELDKHIVGQDQAKKAVAIALRNRWRRAQVAEPLRHEITHKNILMIGPTVVTCQKERSQLSNRETAMKMLKSKLLELEIKKKEEEMKKIQGEQSDIGWGNQIRSYVFQPYALVKDHRTNTEIGNVKAVMDGDIDDFINSYLRWVKNN